MHEYSIVQAVIARVEAGARARGATRVHRMLIAFTVILAVLAV